MSPTMSRTTRSQAHTASSSQWEDDIRQTLDDLIDEKNYKPAKRPDDATERTFKAIEQIKEKWGRGFYATLQQNNVFLPTRLSRDSASELCRIAEAFTITKFCTAIKPLLEQPKKKGKK
jgi:hypothetical protein